MIIQDLQQWLVINISAARIVVNKARYTQSLRISQTLIRRGLAIPADDASDAQRRTQIIGMRIGREMEIGNGNWKCEFEWHFSATGRVYTDISAKV